MRVSVIIKALNEERRIASAIESALLAVAPFGGEVILADSHSTDRTVDIAAGYPIKIARLANPEERCCGIGAQLGFQQAQGDFIYILDGDMTLRAKFLAAALSALEQDSSLAGVGGLVVEHSLDSLEYRGRQQRAPSNLKPGIVDRLDGGGLYRRSAVEAIGYLTNRNLHSYEEFELAVRLRAQGYRLCRLPLEAVDHFGHTIPAHKLLMRRWKSRYICGLGELLRSAWGAPYFPLIWRELGELHLYLLVMLWWISLAGCLLLPVSALAKSGVFAVVAIAPWLLMILKKRSIIQASYSLASWNVHAAGLVRGFFSPLVSPILRIDEEIVPALPNNQRFE